MPQIITSLSKEGSRGPVERQVISLLILKKRIFSLKLGVRARTFPPVVQAMSEGLIPSSFPAVTSPFITGFPKLC